MLAAHEGNRATDARSPAVRQADFHAIVDSLPSRLEELVGRPRKPRAMHGSIPKSPGIYLFSEAGKPIYVGQTRNLRSRLRAHTIPSGTHFSATFAFLLANGQGDHDSDWRALMRSQRQEHPEFKALFLSAKERVAAMDVQFVEIDDPIERTIFEIYAALSLGTEDYNSFETH